jgi:hypothetical protein
MYTVNRIAEKVNAYSGYNQGKFDLLTRQLNASFRPERSVEPESTKGFAITEFPPSQE